MNSKNQLGRLFPTPNILNRRLPVGAPLVGALPVGAPLACAHFSSCAQYPEALLLY